MKVNGSKEEFSLFKESNIFFMISYGLIEVNNIMSNWNELYFFKSKYKGLNIDIIKEAIIKDIDDQTDEKILNGFVWNEKPVKLDFENQFNFKAAYDLAAQTQGANLPIKFKLGEAQIEKGENEYGMLITEKQPIYHTFETMEEFTDFYIKTIAYIQQCLKEGWDKKDNIDWKPYEDILKELYPSQN